MYIVIVEFTVFANYYLLFKLTSGSWLLVCFTLSLFGESALLFAEILSILYGFKLLFIIKVVVFERCFELYLYSSILLGV